MLQPIVNNDQQNKIIYLCGPFKSLSHHLFCTSCFQWCIINTVRKGDSCKENEEEDAVPEYHEQQGATNFNSYHAFQQVEKQVYLSVFPLMP